MNEIIKALSEALWKSEKYDSLKTTMDSVVNERDGLKKKLRETETEKEQMADDLGKEKLRLENAIKSGSLARCPECSWTAIAIVDSWSCETEEWSDGWPIYGECPKCSAKGYAKELSADEIGKPPVLSFTN